MSALAERLRIKYFGNDVHPYTLFEREVGRFLNVDHTLLDAGCGRTAPVLAHYRQRASRLIGIDTVDFAASMEGLELYKRSLAETRLPSGSVDVIMARSVVEHLPNPVAVLVEFRRILRPGGRVVFLTPNFWDYASLLAAAIPNRLHPWIVARTEGRMETDVFPVAYKANTQRAIRRVARAADLTIERLEYLGQYPCYFMFNGGLFLVGAAYEKLISSTRALHWLRGWILCTLVKP